MEMQSWLSIFRGDETELVDCTGHCFVLTEHDARALTDLQSIDRRL
jgi:hypothetical protein